MKKYILSLIVIVFAFIMTFNLSSCSKEEVEPGGDKDEVTIYGTWRCSYGEANKQMTLREDGIVMWYRLDNNGKVTSGPDIQTYTYENGNITYFERPGDIEGIMHVATLTKTQMVTFNINVHDGSYEDGQRVWTRVE